MTNFSINPVEIGARIRALRIKQGKTQTYYADLLYISASYLALIEAGKRIPALEILVQIAKISDVTIDYLVWGNEKDLDESQIVFDRLHETYPPDQMKKALQLAEYFLKLEDEPEH